MCTRHGDTRCRECYNLMINAGCSVHEKYCRNCFDNQDRKQLLNLYSYEEQWEIQKNFRGEGEDVEKHEYYFLSPIYKNCTLDEKHVFEI